MNLSAGSRNEEHGYLFRFDTKLEPLIFGGEVELSGWLFHREGRPIHGIRALIKRRFARDETLPARRKRIRPDVAAAFPDLPEAEASGFLFELRLGLGQNEITFQVRDHERAWRAFASANVTAFPLATLGRLGLPNTRRVLLFFLRQLFATRDVKALPAPAKKATDKTSTAVPRRVDLFATTKSNLFIVEIGELVAAGFRELGCDAQLHLDVAPAETPAEGTMQIVVTPHEFYNLFLTEKLSRAQAQSLTRNVYLLCTEQPETGWFQSNLQWGAHSLGVADISALGLAAYRERDLPAHQLQLGYHPILAHSGRTPHAERGHDITFLGSMTPRREEFFARHAPFFASHRCHLRLVPLGFAKTKETRSYLSIERRNELLSQSRILLNLHYSEQKYFEWHRMLVGLANGCCIITETCQGYGPLLPGKHFVMIAPEYLIAACEYYLAHPAECEKIALAGQAFIETELRQAQTCQAFLKAMEGAKTEAPVALGPFQETSIPLPGGLTRKILRAAWRLFFDALRRDFRDRNAEHGDGSTSVALIAIKRDGVIAKRRGYKQRFAEQDTARARGEPVLQMHDNEASGSSRQPALSVVITLYNYGRHIGECVASVTRAAEFLADPLELVIVNDASTDDSLARALSCQRASRLPVRIVDKKFNTGLADARNIGTEIARAPYVFMMDADNLIFPQGFAPLLGAIRAEDAAAAYSLLVRFRSDQTNRVGLLSYFDWDPQVLVQFPYIDAMALFRRDILLALGGYDNQLNQIGWFGWEDYDMWLKFAQRDYRVAFVPNTLCLYRHHDTSMINSTTLFEPEFVRYFMEHYSELAARYEPREKIFGVARPS